MTHRSVLPDCDTEAEKDGNSSDGVTCNIKRATEWRLHKFDSCNLTITAIQDSRKLQNHSTTERSVVSSWQKTQGAKQTDATGKKGNLIRGDRGSQQPPANGAR